MDWDNFYVKFAVVFITFAVFFLGFYFYFFSPQKNCMREMFIRFDSGNKDHVEYVTEYCKQIIILGK